MKNKNVLISIGVILVLILVGWGIYQRNRQSSSVKIGAILPLTGWGGYWGEGEIKGVQLAEKDITAQGGSVDV